MLRASQTAIDLIKRHEGLRLEAYNDRPDKPEEGTWTIGWGHTKGVAEYPHKITVTTAEKLLAEDIADFEDELHSLLPPFKPTQAQFDALMSFIFNVGAGAFGGSTLRRLLRAGKPREAAAQFIKWVYDGDDVLPGLITRRQVERDLFLQGTP